MRLILQISILILVLGCTGRNKKAEGKSDIQGTIESNGIQFKYVIQGKGEPLLVVGSSVYYPKAFSEILKDKFEMIFVDARHFIPTYDPTDEELASISLMTWADDLEMIRTKLNLDKITVIGHSVHAQIALEYANKFPDNLSRLVIICGIPYSIAEYSDLSNELWMKEADDKRKSISGTRLSKQDSILKITPPNKIFAVSYDLNAPKYWTDPDYDSSYLLNDLKTSPKAFKKLATSIPSKEEVIEKLENLKIPTLVILGKLDFAIPYTAWEQIFNKIHNKNIKYHLINEASHNPQTEEITAFKFDEILTKWISVNK